VVELIRNDLSSTTWNIKGLRALLSNNDRASVLLIVPVGSPLGSVVPPQTSLKHIDELLPIRWFLAIPQGSVSSLSFLTYIFFGFDKTYYLSLIIIWQRRWVFGSTIDNGLVLWQNRWIFGSMIGNGLVLVLVFCSVVVLLFYVAASVSTSARIRPLAVNSSNLCYTASPCKREPHRYHRWLFPAATTYVLGMSLGPMIRRPRGWDE
jgi:hypothetical protein